MSKLVYTLSNSKSNPVVILSTAIPANSNSFFTVEEDGPEDTVINNAITNGHLVLQSVSPFVSVTKTTGTLTKNEAASAKAFLLRPSILLSTSRNALPSDNGGTLELATGITYTLLGTLGLSAIINIIGPTTGTANLAVTAGTINGAGTIFSILANQIYTIVSRPSSPISFVVK